MSLEISSERVCYVHCNFCNTILAVSVPCNSMTTIMTVRCGHCANLLSVNMGALLHSLPLQDLQKQPSNFEDATKNCGSSSKCSRFAAFDSAEHQQPRMPPIRRFVHLISPPHCLSSAPEKRQRVPSAYNRFIKEEIQRIKLNNPEISHREAFSTAAKNWAHFPHIHFGATHDSNKQPKLDHAVAGGEGAHKSRAFC